MSEITKDGRPVVFWDCDDGVEELNHTSKDAAIEAYLDDLAEDHLPDTVILYGYARMTPSEPTMEDAVDLVDTFFEGNWEDFQGEDQPDTPNSTCEAALEFLKVLHKDFVPWACELIESEQVDVKLWINNRSEQS